MPKTYVLRHVEVGDVVRFTFRTFKTEKVYTGRITCKLITNLVTEIIILCHDGMPWFMKEEEAVKSDLVVIEKNRKTWSKPASIRT